MNTQTGRLVIIRPHVGRRDRRRAYSMKVDGVARGKIRPGERLQLDLGPGPHAVQATIDWCRSPEVTITMAPDAEICLRVEPNGSDLTTAWSALFKSSYYVELSPA